MAKRYLVSLFLVICLAFICSEIVIRGYVLTYHRLAEQVFTILNGDKANVIIGDSHTKAAFMDIPPDFVNLSVEGINVMMFEAIVRSYASRNRIEKIIILASPHIFSLYRIDGDVGIYSSLPIGKLDWRNEFYAFNSVYQAALHDTVKWKILNVLQAKSPFELVKVRVMQALGFSPSRSKKDEGQGDVSWQEHSVSHKNYETQRCLHEHAPADDFQNHQFAVQYKKMISVLMEAGADVCLVRTPVSETYDRMYKEKFEIAAMENFFKGMVIDEQGRGNIKYIDYKHLEIAFTDDFLRNTDHLNDDGAKVYTPAIIKKCFGD